MSFEAVPCMFQSTATDGNSASYIGLLIRPSNSASVTQAPTVIPAVVAPSINVQKAHVVPQTVLKIPYTQKAAKADIPSGVFRLQQTATCSTPQCDPWLQRASRPSVSTTFDSPSTSQVIPQMSTGDTYNAVSCQSTSSFFPPIASIAQGFTSGKSSTDLQDSSPVSRVSSQKLQTSYCEYGQNNVSNQRYAAVGVPDNRFTQLPVEIPSNQLTSSCKYQSGYNGTNDCSATPDSGIQSIGDSPRSIGPFVTPMPSPASFVPMVSNDVNDSSNQPSTSYDDDYSDMPRLVPYHQLDEPSCSSSDVAPQITDTTRSENEETGHVDSVPKIAITPSVNMDDLVEELMSHLGPEQRKQFADAIKSKVEVVEDFDKNNCATTSQVSPPTDGSVEEETWDPVPLNDLEEQQHSVGNGEHLPCDEMHTLVAETDTFYGREMSLEGKDEEPWSAQKVEEFNRNNGMPSLDNEQQELCEDEISFICQLRPDISEEETRRRKDIISTGVSESFYEEGSSSESSPKERVVDLDFPEGSTPGSEKNEDSLPICHDDRFEVRPKDAVDLEEEQKCKKRKSSVRHEKAQGKKVKLKEDVQPPKLHRGQKAEKIAEKKVPTSVSHGSVEVPVEGDEPVDGQHADRDVSVDSCRARQKLDEDSKERLQAFRQKVKQQMNEQLNAIIEKVEKQFGNIELQLGPRMHWELPWYRLNWKEVAQRIAERSRLEKLAREKSVAARSRKSGSLKKSSSRTSSKKSSCSAVSIPSDALKTPPAVKQEQESCITIKHNIIVDAYPKVEQMTCTCRTGFCGDKDRCSNRVVLMECSSNCPRGKQCSNRRIQKREYAAKIKTFEKSNESGVGVNVCGDVKNGQFICEYVGEVMSVSTFNDRRKLYDTCKNHYALNLCSGFVIDAYRKGNATRYINHSCSPNCELQRWCVNGQHRIGIFALQDIAKGDEITYDYNWCAYEPFDMTKCTCSSPNCRRFLNKDILMTNKEKKIANKNRLLLLRNVEKSAKRKTVAVQAKSQTERENTRKADHLTAIREYSNEMSATLSDFGTLSKRQFSTFHSSVTALLTQSSANRMDSLLQGVETEFQNALDFVAKQCDKKKYEALKAKLFAVKSKYADRLRKYGPLPQSFEEKPPGMKRKLNTHRILTATADLSYLESGIPVGSYDPDEISHLSEAEADSDCVRCICGITDDDGSMIQCDSCHFWLHDDCVYWSKPSVENAEFECDFCKTDSHRTPAMSIPLRPQPELKLAGCTYYRTLVNARNMQVRLNETVYTQKLGNDNHKAELKRLSEASKDLQNGSQMVDVIPELIPSALEAAFQSSSFSRKDLRCFRVERLFVSPEGSKFVFGWHYARPHEVYCEPGRMFHKNELFATSMFDTLPLDAVVGRCLAVEPRVYCLGRPKMPRYNEDDIYFYEFQQTGKNSRYFEKIASRNHYYINTGPHNFVHFPKPTPLERNFTPFVMENAEIPRNTPTPQNEPTTISSSKRHRSSSRRNSKSQVARLEKLVQKLADQTSVQKTNAVEPVGKNDISPPQKRAKQ